VKGFYFLRQGVVKMKEPSIFLSSEITREDALTIIRWLQDDEVRKYLSDTNDVSAQIAQVISRVNLPVLTHLFNQNGRFYMASDKEGVPVGFVRLLISNTETEIVVVIGDRANWGKKFGTSTISESLKIAIFELRSARVVAKIHKENTRSIRAFLRSGFSQVHETLKSKILSITMEDYIDLLRGGLALSNTIVITEIDHARLQKDGEFKFEGLTREQTRVASMKLAGYAMADDMLHGSTDGLVYGAGRDVFGFYCTVITRR